MAQDLIKQNEAERKAYVKQAVDDSFCGVLISHNGKTDQWEVTGFCEVGFESSILEAIDVAVCRARGAVDDLLY